MSLSSPYPHPIRAVKSERFFRVFMIGHAIAAVFDRRTQFICNFGAEATSARRQAPLQVNEPDDTDPSGVSVTSQTLPKFEL